MTETLRYEGYVVELGKTSFTARFDELNEEAEILYRRLPQRDVDYVRQVGIGCYVDLIIVRPLRTQDGEGYALVEFPYRDDPVWSEAEIQAARAQAKTMVEAWDDLWSEDDVSTEVEVTRPVGPASEPD